ncbi:DNA alkylation repair protein [Heyndrickxia sp. NPDC080065]|uniref:DNA alkylation repair protein n=1 Tax=Heyndrickxia sp. NPDC080065 TaxID=3390568 RepID=UPI003D04AC9D
MDLLIAIEEALIAKADKEEAILMKKYMKDRFDFFGLRAPYVKEVFKQILSEYSVQPDDLKKIVTSLWDKHEREYQMIAIHLLNRYTKWLKEDDIELIEYCITHKSWWDSVDVIATNALGSYMKAFPDHTEEIRERWLSSNNIWLQRSILLYQLKYKKETDSSILFNSILRLNESKEFFIQKAIGWALREYSKTDAEKVIQFVESTKLANLSKREALKWLRAKNMIH